MDTTDLSEFAAKYIWWKTPMEALRFPRRVIAQVMEMGTFSDVQRLAETVGDPLLIEVIRNAEAGWFSPPSWHYWHYRLHLSDVGKVPHLPVKVIPA